MNNPDGVWEECGHGWEYLYIWNNALRSKLKLRWDGLFSSTKMPVIARLLKPSVTFECEWIKKRVSSLSTHLWAVFRWVKTLKTVQFLQLKLKLGAYFERIRSNWWKNPIKLNSVLPQISSGQPNRSIYGQMWELWSHIFKVKIMFL